MSERWLEIPGHHGYEVSDLGRVRSYKRPGGPAYIGGGLNGNGYASVHLHNGRKGLSFGIHQLVMLAFVGPRPEGQEVRHLNGDPTDPRLVNLAYGTRQENMDDREMHRAQRDGGIKACRQGHPYDEANTWIRTDSGGRHRRCKTCATAKNSKYREANPPSHCGQGHELTPENTYIRPDRGAWSCKTCQSAYMKAYKAELRAAKPPKPPRTHCTNGHELTPANTYSGKSGKEECRPCSTLRAAKRRARAGHPTPKGKAWRVTYSAPFPGWRDFLDYAQAEEFAESAISDPRPTITLIPLDSTEGEA